MLVGVDIDGTKTAVVLAEDPMNVLFREEFPTLPNLGPSHALEKIEKLIHTGLCSHGRSGEFRIGVS